MQMNILITGATGLLGNKLCKKLHADGHHIVVLSRNPKKAKTDLGLDGDYFEWNAESSPPPPQSLRKIDGVIHLAGESIANKRWTPEQKKRIYDSRILGTRNLVKGILQDQPTKPKFFISSSAVGFYGDTGEIYVDENSKSGKDFLAEVCRDWEAEAFKLHSVSRVVVLRTGLVMSKAGGLLEKIAPFFKLGLGGTLGNGKQWLSWIHDQDYLSIISFIMNNNSVSGVLNVVSPTPVTNREFTRVLAHTLHRPEIFPIPEFALRMAFGEMSQLFLNSSKVAPKKLLDLGYPFKFRNIHEALQEIFVS